MYPPRVLRVSGSWEEARPGLARLGLLALGVLAITSYADVGSTYYDRFRIPQIRLPAASAGARRSSEPRRAR